MTAGRRKTDPLRREDVRFTTGLARFTADVGPRDLVHAVFVRSPHTHARIRAIDASRALEQHGVLGVWTGRDLEAAARAIPAAAVEHGTRLSRRRALAIDRVLYEGEPVAIVVARSAHRARDAADHVEVDYEPIQAVADAVAATRVGAPQLYDDAAHNIAFEHHAGDAAATDLAFSTCAHTVRLDVCLPRTAAVALEPPACVAAWDPADEVLTVHATTQAPHVFRNILAQTLGLAENRIRVQPTDLGGAFGSRISVSAEAVAVCCAAMRLGQPVMWTGVRREAFLAEAQGRDHNAEAALALDPDGRILAMRATAVVNMGANAGLFAAAIPTHVYSAALCGPYGIPAFDVHVTGVYTNTTPVDAVRGAGRQEATYTRERLIDAAARALGVDAIELRRRNLPEQGRAAAARETLERAIHRVGAGVRDVTGTVHREHRRIGIGVCVYSDVCALDWPVHLDGAPAAFGFHERADVRVSGDGSVTVVTGGGVQGQGHETVFAGIAARVLGVPIETVAVIHADTGRSADGGTFFCRGAAVAGAAVERAAEEVRSRARSLAAHWLGAAMEDVEVRGDVFAVRDDPARSFKLAALARDAAGGRNLPPGAPPGLAASAVRWPDGSGACGTHVAVVEVDAETGRVHVLRYIAVDDVGRRLHARVVEGMIAGGITHGVGHALQECVRREENGQLLTPSLMEYAVPRAGTPLPCEIVPAGDDAEDARGAGTLGAIAAPAAIVNAVLDALAPFGVGRIDPPLLPHTVWEAIRVAKEGR